MSNELVETKAMLSQLIEIEKKQVAYDAAVARLQTFQSKLLITQPSDLRDGPGTDHHLRSGPVFSNVHNKRLKLKREKMRFVDMKTALGY